MSDITSLYKRELTLLHKELKEFVDNHEELTEGDVIENPHINRLTQAFSLLHANLHLTLEESFTHFIDNLFNLLYPHYNAPIPSMAIMVLEPDKKNQEIIELKKGLLLELSNGNKICNFKLCYDTYVIPVKIIKSSCEINDEKKSKSVITIELQAISKISFKELNVKKLRFYIKGISEVKYTIYKNIFNNILSISLNSNNKTIVLDNDKIKKVGFDEQDSVLPKNKQSFIGYRVLTEFFTLTEKFLFFDLDLSSIDLTSFGSNLEIKFYPKKQNLENK
jgi:type VI secretion system protein ImpG